MVIVCARAGNENAGSGEECHQNTGIRQFWVDLESHIQDKVLGTAVQSQVSAALRACTCLQRQDPLLSGSKLTLRLRCRFIGSHERASTGRQGRAGLSSVSLASNEIVVSGHNF